VIKNIPLDDKLFYDKKFLLLNFHYSKREAIGKYIIFQLWVKLITHKDQKGEA
jgi:hypothetical protein